MLSGQWEEGKGMTFPFSICCKLLGNTSCYLRTALRGYLLIRDIIFIQINKLSNKKQL